MFDFGNANDGQRKAISAAEGPVLITAGPGTGKTYTLVQRTIYLIEECNVKPESIFVATFTEKAAKELITRITNELSNRGIAANINEMYIGTFHSLCLRILKEHLEYTRLRRNYRLLDAFDAGDVDHTRFGWLSALEDETLYNKLRALSDKDLELLTLLCVDGFQQADIARRMNCSRNAVHKRLKKIKKILKKG